MVTKTPKDSMTNKWCNLVGLNRQKKHSSSRWGTLKFTNWGQHPEKQKWRNTNNEVFGAAFVCVGASKLWDYPHEMPCRHGWNFMGIPHGMFWTPHAKCLWYAKWSEGAFPTEERWHSNFQIAAFRWQCCCQGLPPWRTVFQDRHLHLNESFSPDQSLWNPTSIWGFPTMVVPPNHQF